MFSELKKIKADYIAALGGSKRQLIPPYTFGRKLTILTSYEFYVVLVFRVYSQLFKFKVFRLFGMLMYQLAKFIFKCDIHPAAKIESGLHLVHGFNVIIGAGATLGSNVCIFDSVSIGKKNVGELREGMPNIKNNVILGTGAKVLGEIDIEEGVLVGANSVVIHSILQNNVNVAGIPARVISKQQGCTL
jgi:serine O-acetyltransferase